MHEHEKILVLGSKKDGATTKVRKKLAEMGADYDFFSTYEFENNQDVACEMSSETIVLQSGGSQIDLAQYKSIYFRFWPSLGHNVHDERHRAKSIIISELYGFLQTTHQLVVNRPLSGISNSSKLLQLCEINEFGFRTLKYVCATTESSISDVLERPSMFVTKGVSGTRTRASSFGSGDFWRLSGLRSAPSLFQERAGAPEFRAHVVDDEVHVVRINSPVVDYRYAEREGHEVIIELAESFPKRLESMCVDFCVEYDLAFAGFDFITDAGGELCLLEVNPSPGFDYYDNKIDGKIANSLADLLARGRFNRFQSPEESDGLRVGEIFLDESRRPDLIY